MFFDRYFKNLTIKKVEIHMKTLFIEYKYIAPKRISCYQVLCHIQQYKEGHKSGSDSDSIIGFPFSTLVIAIAPPNPQKKVRMS
jgi:hypothetical protein